MVNRTNLLLVNSNLEYCSNAKMLNPSGSWLTRAKLEWKRTRKPWTYGNTLANEDFWIIANKIIGAQSGLLTWSPRLSNANVSFRQDQKIPPFLNDLVTFSHYLSSLLLTELLCLWVLNARFMKWMRHSTLLLVAWNITQLGQHRS